MTSLYTPGPAMSFYNVVSASALIFSALTLLFRTSHIYATFSVYCGMVFEQLFCLIFGGLSIAASAWMAQFGSSRNGKLVIASACGFVASLAYFLDFFFVCQARRNVRMLQKEYKQQQQNSMNITKESAVF